MELLRVLATREGIDCVEKSQILDLAKILQIDSEEELGLPTSEIGLDLDTLSYDQLERATSLELEDTLLVFGSHLMETFDFGFENPVTDIEQFNKLSRSLINLYRNSPKMRNHIHKAFKDNA